MILNTKYREYEDISSGVHSGEMYAGFWSFSAVARKNLILGEDIFYAEIYDAPGHFLSTRRD